MGLDQFFKVCTQQNTYDDCKYPSELKVFEDYINERDWQSKTIVTKYQVGYFRKFNALHHYIVKEYGEDFDICQEIYLSKQNIEELRDRCARVLLYRTMAPELLPTADGFFFGSTDYDDWYFEKVTEAKELFDMLLANLDFDKYYVVYQASW